MKTVLLYANEDAGLESRLQAVFDLARAFDAHICCVQVTPLNSFVMGDPFGGVYALPVVVEALRKVEDEHRARIEARLRSEGVKWDWSQFDGSPAQVVADRSRLCDLVVLSQPGGGNYDGPLAMVGDVAIHARAPVLAVPQSGRGLDYLGNAVVAWNGAFRSYVALRLAVPLLERAAKVHVVTVTEDNRPAIDASAYLARHGIESVLHEWPRDERAAAEALLDTTRSLAAAYLVMGAYGHSRLQKWLRRHHARDDPRRGALAARALKRDSIGRYRKLRGRPPERGAYDGECEEDSGRHGHDQSGAPAQHRRPGRQRRPDHRPFVADDQHHHHHQRRRQHAVHDRGPVERAGTGSIATEGERGTGQGRHRDRRVEQPRLERPGIEASRLSRPFR